MLPERVNIRPPPGGASTGNLPSTCPEPWSPDCPRRLHDSKPVHIWIIFTERERWKFVILHKNREKRIVTKLSQISRVLVGLEKKPWLTCNKGNFTRGTANQA